MINIHSMPKEFAWEGDGLATLYLGHATGTRKIYANIDRIAPGKVSCKYHSHSEQEEFLMILAGSGTLRYDGKEYAVTAGDCIAKPAHSNIPHQFINTGTDTLEILDVGTQQHNDIVHYPDEDTYLIKNGDSRTVFDGSTALTDWSSL